MKQKFKVGDKVQFSNHSNKKIYTVTKILKDFQLIERYVELNRNSLSAFCFSTIKKVKDVDYYLNVINKEVKRLKGEING